MSGKLRILRGEPTPEELAALTAIVTAAGADTDAPPQPEQRGRWADPAHAHRQLWRAGPGGWRAGARWG